MYVFDATPLIYLAKIDRLELLESLSRPCLVPHPVHQEVVVRGLQDDHPDARRLERTIENGRLETASVPDTETFERLQCNDRLSDADAAVLALAEHRNGTAIMDEEYGRDVADTEGIPTRGTAYLVLSLLKDGHITESEARNSIDAMLDEGWYCSPNLYKSIQRKIDKLA